MEAERSIDARYGMPQCGVINHILLLWQVGCYVSWMAYNSVVFFLAWCIHLMR